MTRYNYNTQVRPPAPFVHVTIGRPLAEADVVENVPAQLDTGADMTVVPWQIVNQLELVQLNEVPAIGFGGHIVNVPTFLVQLTSGSSDRWLFRFFRAAMSRSCCLAAMS